ncbi:MAG: ribonuclease III [Spirochaetales bacterium]|nr:ribonuclease III [Spirochaetales bacterium]
MFQQKSEVELPPPVSEERRQELFLFEKHAGIRFKNLRFLNLAFCHRSFANETGHVDNNEKLEFLGDSVLGLIVCEYLYREFPDKNEGELARIKSFVVSEASLETIAKKLRVENFILIGRGEEFSGGRSKTAILADCMEGIIGAYFLDSGFKSTRSLVRRLIAPEIDKVLEDRHKKDYKTLLQEHVQKEYKSYPRYLLEKKTGPDHDRTFWVSVKIEDKQYGPGKGKSKKEAERAAAGIAYCAITKKEQEKT